MDLIAAASFFDNTVCTDAYGVSQFRGQLDLYDDSRKDSGTVNRRILSTEPATVIPTRKVITMMGKHWIVGKAHYDEFLGEPIRAKYPIQEADYNLTLKNFQQLLSGAAGSQVYAGRTWLKTVKEGEVTSKLTSHYEFFMADVELPPQKTVIVNGSEMYLVRLSYRSAAGFTLVEVDELASPNLETVTYNISTYDPVADVTVHVAQTIQMLRIRWQSEFDYLTQASEGYYDGDVHGVILNSVEAESGDVVECSDGQWKIVSVTEGVGTKGLHLRRA